MNLQDKRKLLLEFVTLKHKDQVRKYTFESYVESHLIPIASVSDQYIIHGYEIGLCHDILEDTDCSASELINFLLSIEYDIYSVEYIISGVIALTDVFIKEDFPDLNRKRRKELERTRLSMIKGEFQTIKYIDIQNNIFSIYEHDKGFAKIFIDEITQLLLIMRRGDASLLFELESYLKSLEF
jgi:hypothetical protein